MKKLYYGLFMIMLVFTMVACTTTEDTNKVESIKISGVTEVLVGESITLTAAVTPSDALVSWNSSDAAVASVAGGVVTGVKEGTAVISATAGDKKDEITVTVKAKQEGVEPNTEVHTVADSRPDAYVAYSSEGVEVSKFKSLYTAIEFVVNNESFGAYVTKAEGEDKNFKLFTFSERFASDSDDMFYFYAKGNQLDTYTSWAPTYWQDLANIGDAIAITVSPSLGVNTYFNSHKLVGVSSTNQSAKGTQYWNVQTQIEASATVNMLAYSGITRQEYDVKLSESRIYPSMNAEQTAKARVGFIVTDAYNTSNMGLAMDPKTGNWYYYAAETPWDWNGLEDNMDKSVTLMTSTWNEAGYFQPNEDVNFTAETLKLEDGEGGTYIVDRLTMHFVQSNRTVVRDYEYAQLTQAGTIRFTASLDIDNAGMLTDYMNGARFENLVVTRAVATALESMQDIANYGLVAELEAGVYDVLNSNPETAARYQTILYNPAVVSVDFSTPGKDVYNFSYNLDVNNGALSHHIQAVIDAINALPAYDQIVLEDRASVEAARALYNTLSTFRNVFVTNLEVLVNAEFRINELDLNANELAAVSAALKIKGLSEYADLASLVADTDLIKDAAAKYALLTEEELAKVLSVVGSNKVSEVNAFLLEVEKVTDETSREVINFAMWIKDFTFDGPVASTAQMLAKVELLTEEQIALLPTLTKEVLTNEGKLPLFAKNFGQYMTTYEFILYVMETYNVSLDNKVLVGEGAEAGYIVDTTMVNHEEIAEKFAEVAAIWKADVMSESWNFRNNYAGRFDFVVEGGFAKYYPVLYSLLYNSTLYGYDWGTGLILNK